MKTTPSKTNDFPVRERLLDAADRLFYQEGIRAVGVDRLLQEAGAAKASLYAHFGGKDELIAAYVGRRIEAARADIDQYLEQFPESERALRFFDFVVEWTLKPDFRGCPVQHLVGEIADCTHPARVLAVTQRQWLAERFQRWAKAAGANDPERTAGALQVLFDGAVSASLQDGPKRARDARWTAEQLLGRR
ncbi:TetR/AcrR family transcriptional regulator [Permianibacter sp. IMCC34836]|uniref:TetR/AcrR family transcriptional regulator n=1 Tax=Permianibacter fluminis TaxID=2738515 RepID=UPI0015569D30|nr:TetR/AcrR family transcriptional regulator [Permianibacter fluminis]NQD36611.1 TetR/AcrR family transcriptional regulator [Permianibacter fluminis]